MRTKLRLLAIGVVALASLVGVALFWIGPAAILQAALDVRHVLTAWIAAHPVLGVVAFVALATGGMLTPFPSATLIQMTGGVAFGALGGGVLAAAGASFSSAVALLVGRLLLVHAIDRHFGERLAPARRAFTTRPFHALLTLRLFPGCPAWLGNLVPIPFPVPMPKVMLATFLGVLPICLTFSSVGSALGSIAAVENAQLTDVVNLRTVLPLAALFVLAAASLLIRRRIEQRKTGTPSPLPLPSTAAE